MRSAYERDCEVVTLTDCVAATPPTGSPTTRSPTTTRFFRSMSSKEFLDELGEASTEDISGGY